MSEAQARPTDLEFARYYDDPCGFARDVLKLRLWRRQRDLLKSIAENPKTAVASGQKTGKSTCFVVAGLWWTATRPRGRVLLTGPTNHQVDDVLWTELRRVCFRTRDEVTGEQLFNGRCVADILGARPAKVPSTGMQWHDGREIIGFSADKPESLQGISSPELLILADEGSGIADALFQALDGNLAGGGVLAAAGNPTQLTGWFFDAFHSKREHWSTLTISSEETPNCTGEEPAIPGLADPAFIEKRRAEYGEDSPFYRVRVKGLFPGTSSNAVIGLDDITAAQKRYTLNIGTYDPQLDLGVDVARFGDDDSAVTPRRGVRISPPKAVHGFDTVALVGLIVTTIRDMRLPGEPKARVKVDVGGGYGNGVVDLLRASHSDVCDVFEVNSSSEADDPTYFNLRSQLHFATRDWLRDHGELPSDKRMEAELLEPKYGFDPRVRFKVEGKDEIKKRLQRSPDRGDSVMLAIYSPMKMRSRKVEQPRSDSRWSSDHGRGY